MATRKSENALPLSPALSGALDEHLSRLRQSIIDKTQELSIAAHTSSNLANDIPETPATLKELNQACNELILGNAGPSGHTVFQYFPPFTIVCTFLCLSFALLGLWAMSGSGLPPELVKASSGFLDIAKIFAGAIVGSTASTVLSTSRGRRSR